MPSFCRVSNEAAKFTELPGSSLRPSHAPRVSLGLHRDPRAMLGAPAPLRL